MIKTFTEIKNKTCKNCGKVLDVYEGTYNHNPYRKNGKMYNYFLCHKCQKQKITKN